MWPRFIEFIAGLLVAGVTLRDVFYTVVVPGSARGLLRISRRLVHAALPVWKRVMHRGVGLNFAPLMLVSSFAIWMLLLLFGFGLMAHSLRDYFDPELENFGHALYVAGGALSTTGFGTTEPHGIARAVSVAAGLCGLSVMTLAVTYLLEVQTNISQRDAGVLKITTTSGQPPSALVLLERYAALGCRDELADVLRGGRDWCATVLQSHASHPWLVYFRSVGTGTGWPAALGALMDLALIAEQVIDEPALRGPAVLAREEGWRLSRNLAQLVDATTTSAPTSHEEAERVFGRLVAAGYRLRADRDVAQFVAARDKEVSCIQALAHHLGGPEAPLLPQSKGGPQ
jgi:hypothetical protein